MQEIFITICTCVNVFTCCDANLSIIYAHSKEGCEMKAKRTRLSILIKFLTKLVK